MTDALFSTVAILDYTGAALVERVTYDSYGQARHHFFSDVDGDGDSSDLTTIQNLDGIVITDATYNVECDIDRDGDIDEVDYNLANVSGTDTALALGVLTSASVDSQLGFSGHIYNVEVGLYLMRMRFYSPEQGRFIERDPAGYVDGMNLYEYVRGNPVMGMDPYGLYGPDRPWYVKLYNKLFPLNGLEMIYDTHHRAKEISENTNDDSLWGYLLNLGAALTGMQDLAEGIAGIDVAEGELLNPLERWLRGTLGLINRVLIVIGGTKVKPSFWLTGVPKCFVAGTLVLTATGYVAIEEIDVGDRVYTTDFNTSSDEETEIDEKDWRLIDLLMPNPDFLEDTIEVRLLRPVDWIEQMGARAGLWIPFEFPELNFAGPAFVRSISECPKIKPGPGRIVLATVSSNNSNIYELGLENSEAVLRLTWWHRLYSEDRQDWVATVELEVGEELRSIDGSVTIKSINRILGVHRVYNIEVDTDHSFYVTRDDILTHNAGPCPKPPISDIKEAIREARRLLGKPLPPRSPGGRGHLGSPMRGDTV